MNCFAAIARPIIPAPKTANRRINKFVPPLNQRALKSKG